MESESWEQYLYTAKTKLNELTTDQIATCAKIIMTAIGRKHLFMFYKKLITKGRASGLISFGDTPPCRFESGHGHHIKHALKNTT